MDLAGLLTATKQLYPIAIQRRYLGSEESVTLSIFTTQLKSEVAWLALDTRQESVDDFIFQASLHALHIKS